VDVSEIPRFEKRPVRVGGGLLGSFGGQLLTDRREVSKVHLWGRSMARP
jgi:hypothetical protein